MRVNMHIRNISCPVPDPSTLMIMSLCTPASPGTITSRMGRYHRQAGPGPKGLSLIKGAHTLAM